MNAKLRNLWKRGMSSTLGDIYDLLYAKMLTEFKSLLTRELSKLSPTKITEFDYKPAGRSFDVYALRTSADDDQAWEYLSLSHPHSFHEIRSMLMNPHSSPDGVNIHLDFDVTFVPRRPVTSEQLRMLAHDLTFRKVKRHWVTYMRDNEHLNLHKLHADQSKLIKVGDKHVEQRCSFLFDIKLMESEAKDFLLDGIIQFPGRTTFKGALLGTGS